MEVFKISNGYDNIDCNIVLKIKAAKITKWARLHAVEMQSRSDVRKYSFSQRNI